MTQVMVLQKFVRIVFWGKMKNLIEISRFYFLRIFFIMAYVRVRKSFVDKWRFCRFAEI